MVREAEKPSLRDASCCKVLVVKGGAGRRFTRFVSTSPTDHVAPSIREANCLASASVLIESLSSLTPSAWVSLPRTVSSFSFLKRVSTLQYSSVMKRSISPSRSQISRNATD